MIGDNYFSEDVDDRWAIPNDRQLALRSRMGTGWSTIHKSEFKQHQDTMISDAECNYLITVLRRNERIQLQEQYRIGRLVTMFEHMKNNIHGDGNVSCLICGSRPGMFKDSLHFCGICGQLICSKCSIEHKPPADSCGKYYLCVLCNEIKMLWKRSGAWFYKSIPKYILPCDIEDRDDCTDNNFQGQMVSPRPSSYGSLESEDSDDIGDAALAFEISDDQFSSQYTDINTEGKSQSLDSFSTYSAEKRKESIETISLSSSSNDEMRSEFENESVSREHALSSNRSTEETKSIYEKDKKDLNSKRGSIDLNSKRGSTDLNSKRGSTDLNSKRGSTDLNSKRDSIDSFIEPTGGFFQNTGRLTSVSSSDSVERLVQLDEDGNNWQRSNNTINCDHAADAACTSLEDEKENKNEYTGEVGKIKFTLQYDSNTQELLIIVDSCIGLKSGKEKEKDIIPSTYVQCILLPVQSDSTKASRKRTPTIKKTSDPVYNFCIVYPGVSISDIKCKGVQLSVIYEHKYTIGEICIPLKGLTSHPIQQFRRILDTRAHIDTLFLDIKKVEVKAGRIELSLQYLSKEGKLIVGIIRCVGLKALDPNGYSDPYVKCYLLPDPEKKSKQKTTVKKKTLNPEFNEEMQFEISHSELAQKYLYVAVWDYDVGRSNDYIGGLCLGVESKGDALQHWFEALKSTDQRFTTWHDLDEKCKLFND